MVSRADLFFFAEAGIAASIGNKLPE